MDTKLCDMKLAEASEQRDTNINNGVDIAETTDLTSAKILLLNPADRKRYIHQIYFIPSGKLAKADDKSAGAKYEEWARKGLVRIEEGNYIDTSVIADWLFGLYKKYGIKPFKTGYDAKFANEFVNRMDQYGFVYDVFYLVGLQVPDLMKMYRL